MRKLLLFIFFIPIISFGQWSPMQKIQPTMVNVLQGLRIPITNSTISPWTDRDSIAQVIFNPTSTKLMYRASGTTFKTVAIEDSLKAYAASVLTVGTIALLRADNGYALSGKTAAYVKGYYANNDGGGGWFVYDATSTLADNAGTVIKPTTATTGRWVRDINPSASTINVKWFGAKGDGVNDDTGPIQAAITATLTGGTLYFPSSSNGLSGNKYYKISSNLRIDSSGVTLFSDGGNESNAIIKSTGSNFTMLTVYSNTVNINNMSFIGDGGLLLSPVPTVNGILFTGDASGNIDAFITNSSFFLLNQSLTAKGRNINVFDNLFSNSRYGLVADTIAVAGEMRGFVVQRNRFHTMGKFQLTDACVYSTDKSNFEFQISDNYLDGQSNAYLALLKASKNVLISGNHVTLNRTGMVQLDTCNVFTISGNEFVGGTSSPAAVSAIALNGSGFGNISGNNINISQQEGIKLYNGGANSNLITNNEIVDFSAVSGFYAISATAATVNNVIQNNSIRSPNATYTPAGSILNSNNTNTTFNNAYHPSAGLGRPAYTESNANILLNNTSATNQFILRVGQASGTNSITIQAGEGSDPWGASLALFGAAHATLPGQARIGLSSSANGKFVVNTAGLTVSGTDLFSVLSNGVTRLSGSQENAVRIVTATTTLTATDYYLGVNNTANVIVNLPAAATCLGRVYTICKVSNNGFTVTITPASGTVGGAATIVLSSFESVQTLWSDGTNWHGR